MAGLASTCCSMEAQSSCCDRDAKSACCDADAHAEGSCGCSAGQASAPVADVREDRARGPCARDTPPPPALRPSPAARSPLVLM